MSPLIDPTATVIYWMEPGVVLDAAGVPAVGQTGLVYASRDDALAGANPLAVHTSTGAVSSGIFADRNGYVPPFGVESLLLVYLRLGQGPIQLVASVSGIVQRLTAAEAKLTDVQGQLSTLRASS